MAYEIKLLDLAERDIGEICRYLSQFYPGTPGKFLDALEKGLDSVSFNPNMCLKFEYNNKYRKMVIDDFLVFYKTDETNNKVYIYRVLHGKRNVGTILKKLSSKD